MSSISQSLDGNSSPLLKATQNIAILSINGSVKDTNIAPTSPSRYSTHVAQKFRRMSQINPGCATCQAQGFVCFQQFNRQWVPFMRLLGVL